MMRLGFAVVVTLAISLAPTLFSQASEQKPSFEAASIKPGDAYDGRIGIRIKAGGRLSTTNTPLKMLINYAYDANNQIVGGSPWLDSETFNIEAKADSTTPFPTGSDGVERMRLMLQSLLAERFKLAVHWDTKEEQVYELGIAKGGPKLKEVDANNTGAARMQVALGHFVGTAQPISQLVRNLSQRLGRPVIDKTALTGRYDFELTYTPDPGQMPAGGQPLPPGAPPLPDPNGPSIFAALEEHLGLKLQSTKGPVRVLAIDHAEKPDAN
jgi:uncharacterized protein (TIGR03435 family)